MLQILIAALTHHVGAELLRWQKSQTYSFAGSLNFSAAPFFD